MILRSLQFKLSALVGVAFVVTAIVVVLLANQRMVALIDVNQEIIGAQRLGRIEGLLDKQHQRLQQTTNGRGL